MLSKQAMYVCVCICACEEKSGRETRGRKYQATMNSKQNEELLVCSENRRRNTNYLCSRVFFYFMQCVIEEQGARSDGRIEEIISSTIFAYSSDSADCQ